MKHRYICRETGSIKEEKLFGDRCVRFLYSHLRENANWLFEKLTDRRFTSLLAYFNFDSFFNKKLNNTLINQLNNEEFKQTLYEPENIKSLRDFFERKIKYWEVRPMPEEEDVIVSPCDAKMLVGSNNERSLFWIKGVFFDFPEIIGDKSIWANDFRDGDFAIFRLTPDKYHYNHMPVTGKVLDFYILEGKFHSCNPNTIISFATPYSKNLRTVTIIDTDIKGGTNIGLVAFVEVAALMVGDIVQCYSENKYENPVSCINQMVLKKGCPKSLFKPGSSTVIVFFEKDRVSFSKDLVQNRINLNRENLFNNQVDIRLIETEVKVREEIGRKRYGLCN